MNVLDENIPDDQRFILRRWRIHVRQIGHEVGYHGMGDEEIIPLLHQIGSVTFFSHDQDFYEHNLCHSHYCIVCLAVSQYEMASFIRRFLQYPDFNTNAKRMGKVVRLSHNVIRLWQINSEKEEELTWFT